MCEAAAPPSRAFPGATPRITPIGQTPSFPESDGQRLRHAVGARGVEVRHAQAQSVRPGPCVTAQSAQA